MARLASKEGLPRTTNPPTYAVETLVRRWFGRLGRGCVGDDTAEDPWARVFGVVAAGDGIADRGAEVGRLCLDPLARRVFERFENIDGVVVGFDPVVFRRGFDD